jgi:hypothetical protein
VAFPSLVGRGSTARDAQVQEPDGPVLPSERFVQSESEHGSSALALTATEPAIVKSLTIDEDLDADGTLLTAHRCIPPIARYPGTNLALTRVHGSTLRHLKARSSASCSGL